MMTMNHVHLGTKDLPKIKGFYEKYFGFQKKFDHGNGVFLTNAAGFLIAIDPVEKLPELPEWYHLGFCLGTPDEVLKIYEQMKVDGVNITRDLKTLDNEFASFFVKDPDGNKIEVSWHNE